LELDADGPQCGAPQAVRKAISLNLTKKTKMRTKSSSTKTSKSSRRDRKDRDIDGTLRYFFKSAAIFCKKRFIYEIFVIIWAKLEFLKRFSLIS